MTTIIYKNNEATAEVIGWKFLPEFVFGDASKDFIHHDHNKGIFNYVTKEEGEQIKDSLFV